MTLLPKYSAHKDRPLPSAEERARIAAKAKTASEAITSEKITRSQDWKDDPTYLRFRQIAAEARERK